MLTSLTLADNQERVLRDPVLTLDRITLLAGPNGSGKSTVFDAIKDLILNLHNEKWTRQTAPVLLEGNAKAVYCMSFERDNPRTVKMDLLHGQAYGAALLSRFRSHGQSNRKLLEEALEATEFDVMVLDEPEAALDLDGLLMLRASLLSTTKQVILATHSPLLLCLSGSPGVSVQVFGPDPQYVTRVLQVYEKALSAGYFPQPQSPLPHSGTSPTPLPKRRGIRH